MKYSVERNEDGAKIMVKNITIIQQRSTGKHSTVDSRRRLTNFKTLVSHSNVSSLETVCLTIVTQCQQS